VFDEHAGLNYDFGHARAFFPARQELAIAQTACRASKNTLAWPARHWGWAESMLKTQMPFFQQGRNNQLLNQ
jgi:hypothetical protein